MENLELRPERLEEVTLEYLEKRGFDVHAIEKIEMLADTIMTVANKMDCATHNTTLRTEDISRLFGHASIWCDAYDMKRIMTQALNEAKRREADKV